LKYAFFRIPLVDCASEAMELNQFLATHKTYEIEQHFVQDSSNSCWAICVSYESAHLAPKGTSQKQKIEVGRLMRERVSGSCYDKKVALLNLVVVQ